MTDKIQIENVAGHEPGYDLTLFFAHVTAYETTREQVTRELHRLLTHTYGILKEAGLLRFESGLPTVRECKLPWSYTFVVDGYYADYITYSLWTGTGRGMTRIIETTLTDSGVYENNYTHDNLLHTNHILHSGFLDTVIRFARATKKDRNLMLKEARPRDEHPQ